MQEREEVHRGCGGLARRAAGFVFLISLWIGSPAAGRCDFPTWDRESGMSRAALPCPELFVPSRDNFAGVFCSYADPYMLEDLAVSVIRAGLRTPERSAWMSWFHLGHPLYREDRLALSLGSSLPVRSFSLRIAPAIERCEVRGFPARTSRGLSCSFDYEYDRAFMIGIEGTAQNGGSGARREASLVCALRAGAFSMLLHHVLAGERRGNARVWFLAALGNRATLYSGYRAPTDELVCGLAVATRPFLFGFSWSYHPALGKTVSAGFGRWWAW